MWEIVNTVINHAVIRELYPYGHSSFFVLAEFFLSHFCGKYVTMQFMLELQSSAANRNKKGICNRTKQIQRK